MQQPRQLLDNNRAWAERQRAQDRAFFERLAAIQRPEYLWIGCSDSRVPANQITGLQPGEVFVHRNIANVVVHTDLNCLSVVQFAVDVLGVKHVIVCGHYGCGGVKAALESERLGLIDNWLRHIEDVRDKHAPLLASLPSARERWARLCELNVIEQAMNLSRTTVVRDAWARGRRFAVHGWIYGLADGLLHDLGVSLDADQDPAAALAQALAKYREK